MLAGRTENEPHRYARAEVSTSCAKKQLVNISIFRAIWSLSQPLSSAAAAEKQPQTIQT